MVIEQRIYMLVEPSWVGWCAKQDTEQCFFHMDNLNLTREDVSYLKGNTLLQKLKERQKGPVDQLHAVLVTMLDTIHQGETQQKLWYIPQDVHCTITRFQYCKLYFHVNKLGKTVLGAVFNTCRIHHNL